jgi:hypothetical protein
VNGRAQQADLVREAALEFMPTRRPTPESSAISIEAAGDHDGGHPVHRAGELEALAALVGDAEPGPVGAAAGPGAPQAPAASTPAPTPSPRSKERRETVRHLVGGQRRGAAGAQAWVRGIGFPSDMTVAQLGEGNLLFRATRGTVLRTGPAPLGS